MKTLDFYKIQFKGNSNRPDEEIFQLANEFKRSIEKLNIDYSIEIEAIANSVDIDPLWIYALNSRSEIMNKFHIGENLDLNECTSLYFKETKLIGQNWDWASELEDLVVLTRIMQENKPDILMMTEPGIIGKIGFNSNGLGVLLNFLHIDGFDPFSVPTHILLRAVLDCNSIVESKELLTEYNCGRTSNIFVGDKFGNYFDIEYAGDEYFLFDDDNRDTFIHTNHYLGKEINKDPVEYASSFARYERGLHLVSNIQNQDLESFKQILLDKENKDLAICRKYKPSLSGFLNDTGTICSMIMNLEQLTMHITRGNPFENL
ncbi:MAG: C45 family autoproteolytic acyltransferase/hydrolase, partial [Candidatus Heimdallarchaeota archaeon]